MTKFEKARQKYRPEAINYLFVAETPPKLDSNRFFYFENVDKHDYLFLETMKCLYPNQTQQMDTKIIRKNKQDFLEKFKSDNFYLIDSLEMPFEQEFTYKQKELLIKSDQKHLLIKIRQLCNDQTKVILISKSVYNANSKYLLENGINVINKEMIDFPGFGGQKKFKLKLSLLLK